MELTDWLLKRGAAVDHADTAGVTPLMIAAEGASAQLLSVLLEHGANLHACSAAGCNALHLASCSGEPAKPSPPQCYGLAFQVWSVICPDANKDFVGLRSRCKKT